jgi:2'-5' RNA ligase
MTHRAVVSLLDADHEVAVRRIWDRLAVHGLETDLWVTPIPHITYHVADAYCDKMVENLSLVAGETRPFMIRTAGLGMFSGENPVIYLPVVRNEAVDHVHGQIWHSMEQTADGANQLYSPPFWVPHITIGQVHGSRSATVDALMTVVSDLCPWEIELTELAVIEGAGQGARTRARIPFGLIGSEA